MSEEFYKYISKKIIDYFINEHLTPGEKFYTELDEKSQVDNLYKYIKLESSLINDSNVNLQTFSYIHNENAKPFETYCLEINNIKIVVATSNLVTMDYLVTLRNAVGEQKDKWKNTALLIICVNSNDSIQYGMRNLQLEGMPLHLNNITNNLLNEIKENKEISKVDRECINFYLNQKLDDIYDTTIWDYEDILGIINQGKINQDDYEKISLFPDSGLKDDMHVSRIRKRINDNHKEFEKVLSDYRYDNVEDRLNKRYNEKGVKKLNANDWEKTDFNNLNTYLLKNKESFEYLENEIKETVNGLEYWEKEEKDTAAGRRKRHIIIFNPNNFKDIEIDFKFDKTIKKSFLNKNGQKFCKTSGKILKVYLTSKKDITTFKSVSYTHNNLSKLKYEFKIAIVNCDKKILEPIQSLYTILPSKKFIQILNEGSEQIVFGKGSNIIEKNISVDGEEVPIFLDDSITINEDSDAWVDDEQLNINLMYESSYKIPISIKEEYSKAIPTKSINIWNLKRENQQNFVFNGSKAVQGVNSFYVSEKFKKVLNLEKQIITNFYLSGVIDVNNYIEPVDLKLNEDLKNKYNQIIYYYQKIGTDENSCSYPSLTYLDDNLEKLYNDFLELYNKEIQEISDDDALSEMKNKFDLNKIGVYKTNNNIYFSSLSPINMAYQLEIKKQLLNEKLDMSILNRLNPENLIPYIFNDKDELFKPAVQNIAKEWIKYEKEDEVNIGSTNQFIANVIYEKLNQFINTFSYLFSTQQPASIKLNVVNIKDDKEIVKGVFNFIYQFIKEGKEIIPVELNLYNRGDISYFDKFFNCNTIDELNDNFELKISSRDLDLNDILHIIQKNITYYKNIKEQGTNYEYAHLSFYKIGENIRDANSNMDNIDTGVYLSGLISESTAFDHGNGYRVGFGTKGLLNQNNLLIKTAINTNELMLSCKNKGDNTYLKRKTIIAKPKTPEEDDIDELYESSIWVTFIEPIFGLEYFERDDNLIIVHYSDQYTSSNKYDTITVTDKNKEYENIIQEFSYDNNTFIDENQMKNIIKIFNGINGEWLLRVISQNNKINRDKLSIISAIKYLLKIYEHEKILWIPISMDEVYRISLAINLTIDDDLNKILKKKIKNSDYLLFFGIEDNNGELSVYYHPIEVKNAIDLTEPIKASNDIKKIVNIFNSPIFINDSFRSKFIRNFFVQIALANIKKLSITDIFSEDDLNKLDQIKPKLLNDEYELSQSLTQYSNEASSFAFKEDESSIYLSNQKNIQLIEMPNEFAISGISEEMDEIDKDLTNKEYSMPVDSLIRNTYVQQEIINIPKENNEDTENSLGDNDPKDNYKNDVDERIFEEDSTNGNKFKHQEDDNTKTDSTNEEKHNITDLDNTKTNAVYQYKLDDVRILLGTLNNSDQKIYWEYGNSQLSNRHMLIVGKSGYGKTYFMQCLIKEMSSNNIPTLIIDYSDSFKNKEIQEELKEYLGNNLITYYVRMKGFPLNPFRKNMIEFDEGEYMEEDNRDVSSRVKSVFSSVYNIGPVQQNTLTKYINQGLNKYGKDMSFDYLMDELVNSDDNNAISVLGQINEFLEFNPFSHSEEFEWSVLDSRNKKVIIIQLTGYSRDVQKIITEFILWDLWNYKKSNGTSDKPFNIILDEAQNLDFSNNNSPSVKILKEGRKYGWSSWFATQTLKGLIKNSDANPFKIAEEIIYFHPTDDVKKVADEFTINNQEREKWSDILSELKKGECIVVGPTKFNISELNPSKPYYIKIDSLNDRID